mmetsp:Transcript_3460/g.5181  ORF Transcript_3460/g.5181 Transcript_3460/m.5181 type:complete len:457 (+) Transcript_3460:51-1421(+)
MLIVIMAGVIMATEVSLLECKSCKFITNNIDALKAHEKQYGTHFGCSNCPKIFKYRHVRDTHVKVHKKVKAKYNLTSAAGLSFQCQFCDQFFSQKASLDDHTHLHTGIKPFRCTHCQQRFSQRMLLDLHMRAHSGDRPYHCQICGRTFRSAVYLSVHHRTHTKERPYACTQCSKAFTQKEALNRHRRTHTGEKPYECGRCFRRFNVRSSLTRHLRLHSGTKLSNCTMCGKPFVERSTFLRHAMTHISVPPLRCAYCSASYPLQEQCKRHRDNHTNIKALLSRAELNDSGAMVALFEAYKEGLWGVEKSIPVAMNYLRSAIEYGNVQAFVYLGVIKCLGLFREYGEIPDPHLGAILFARASENQSVEGSYYLAQCYQHGVGVQRNDSIHQRLEQEAQDLEAEYQACNDIRDSLIPPPITFRLPRRGRPRKLIKRPENVLSFFPPRRRRSYAHNGHVF